MRQAVSRTAQVVALWRARESARPPTTRLFEDALAPAFLSPRHRLALWLSRLPVVGALVPWALVDGHWTGSRGTVVARTRFIDDALGGALRSGAEQVVIFGAGFDSRAYRVAGIERARVFEVDHPATQAEKKRAIARRLRPLPAHVVFVAIDFDTDTLGAAMARSGFRTGVRTFFVCEGVTHYLTAPAVDAMFRYVAQSSVPGSRMVFTYIHQDLLDGSAAFVGAERTLAIVRQSGEPYTFGFDPAELPGYLAARGLSLIEDVGAREFRDRYLAPRGRGHEGLSEFQRAALVEVSGGLIFAPPTLARAAASRAASASASATMRPAFSAIG